MNPLPSYRRAVAAVALVALSSVSFADKYFVVQKNRLLPLVGAEEHHPVVEVRGQRKTIKNGEIATKPGGRPSASDASVEARSVKLVTQSNPSSKLLVSLEVEADADIDAPCLVIRNYESIGSNIQAVVAELPALEANVSQSIELEIPMAFNWSIRPVSVAMLSAGEKVPLRHGPTLKARERQGDEYADEGVARTTLRPYSRMPRVLFQVGTKAPPEGLLDDAKEAFVVVEFYIDTDGVIREAAASEFTHEGLVDLAIESIKSSKFVPAVKKGENYRVKTRQKIWFKRSAE